MSLNDAELGLDELFLASARQDLLTIELALERRDYPSIQFTVHSLKGAAMIFRMTATVNATEDIEAVLSQGPAIDHERLGAACRALRQQIEPV